MIGATSKILLGVIVSAALLVALAVAMCIDLFAPETRPALRRPRRKVGRRRPAIRSLMEART